MKNRLYVLFGLVLVSCASMKVGKVQVTSVPSGAEVLSFYGKSLGVTPLTLTAEMILGATYGNKIFLLLQTPGFMEREVIFDLHGEDTIEVNLTQLDAKYFTERFMSDFSQKGNEMARELLRIHGMVITRNFDDAEKNLELFQQTYPAIAAAYVLSADVYAARGDLVRAQAYLNRAYSIDKDDPVVLMMIERVKQRSNR